MIATQTLPRLSVEEYLAYERESDCRHELLGGVCMSRWRHPWTCLRSGSACRSARSTPDRRACADRLGAHPGALSLASRMDSGRRGCGQIDLACTAALPV